jgi:GGDEF domain-containing protein
LRALVYLDLDDFRRAVKAKGWTHYAPNPITAELSEMVVEISETHAAAILSGLDFKRGTEEALLFFSDIPEHVLEEELEDMRKRIESLGKEFSTGTTISIGVAANIPGMNLGTIKRQDIKRHPILKLAYDALRKAKKRGNCVAWG